MVQTDGLSNIRWITCNCADGFIIIRTRCIIGKHVACGTDVVLSNRCCVIHCNWAVVFNNDSQGRSGACTMVVGNAGRNGEVNDVFLRIIRMIDGFV